MISANEKSNRGPSAGRSGSAMILVIVLTVLLSMIGLMFILASRIEQATSLSANVDRDLSAGVDSIVDRVSKVLVDDLFGSDRRAGLCDGTSKFSKQNKAALVNETYDSSQNLDDADLWLSPVEPDYVNNSATLPDLDITDDVVNWTHPTDLYYNVKGIYDDSIPGLPSFSGIMGGDTLKDSFGAPNVYGMLNLTAADADGDGVWDSVWIKLPNISSAKGQPLYSAVRIIDNCAMLNLNTAFKLEATSEGQYLSAVDYERFLRSRDRDPIGGVGGANGSSDVSDPDSIRKSRLPGNIPGTYQETVASYHTNVIDRIENPYYRDQNTNTRYDYRLFDLSDEMEIRNRYLLTSFFTARFEREDIAYETFDLHRGEFVPLQNGQLVQAKVKRVPFDDSTFDDWKWRVNPANFDDTSGAYFVASGVDYRWAYDRRHICTFYSFDRNIRSGKDLVLDSVIKSLQTAYQQETDPTKKAANLTILNTVRSVFWAPNGSAASTRDLVIADTPESRKAILQLLYALRAYYLRYGNPGLTEADILADLADPAHPKQLLSKAARKAAQTVANMIDYLDDTSATTPGPFFNSSPYNFGSQRNNDPTFIDEAIVQQLVLEASNNTINPTDVRYAFGLGSHVVYGYERQPFISELYCTFSTNGIGRFAVEFVNPYDQDIRLEGWRIVAGNPKSNPRTLTFAANSTVPKGTTTAPGRFVLRNFAWGALPNNTPTYEWLQMAGGSTGFTGNDMILLQRPIPDGKGGKTWLTVDSTGKDSAGRNMITPLLTDGTHVTKRDDRAWKFTRANEFTLPMTDDIATLGLPNNATIAGGKKGYQMPVADNNTAIVSKPLATLGDFEKILSIGSEWIAADDPNAVTHFMGLALNEGDVRPDIVSAPKILGYVGFLNRPAGNLPGRINVNTASKEVIRAAIPAPTNPGFGSSPDQLAAAIINWRENQGYVFTSLADLLKVVDIAKLGNDLQNLAGSDPSMTDDIEERDWILSRLSNIFTVRSDTFTAYIALRIGAPRVVTTPPANRVVDVDADRRYIAIFDRSAVDQPDESPRLVALHPVPDAR